MLESGKVKGVNNISPPLRLAFIPFLSSYVNFSKESETLSSFNGGMDIKYGINEAFTLDVTLLPDFGQVVFDNQVLNISPYEIEFNEKTLFSKLSSDEYKIICINTKIITQRAIMGANITDNDAFDLYTANGGTTGKYSVNWDEKKNKCFAQFTVKPLSGSSKSVTVKGEALGFLKTSIDTRVYFIKNF